MKRINTQVFISFPDMDNYGISASDINWDDVCAAAASAMMASHEEWRIGGERKMKVTASMANKCCWEPSPRIIGTDVTGGQQDFDNDHMRFLIKEADAAAREAMLEQIRTLKAIG